MRRIRERFASGESFIGRFVHVRRRIFF